MALASAHGAMQEWGWTSPSLELLYLPFTSEFL